jgi:hypothetical protein
VYRLDNRFAHGHFTVTVVGCGGTGGFVAEGVARLLPPRADLVLIDHDRVEERNLIRQNFTSEEMGQFKSETLARRLSQRYNLPVAYSILPVAMAEIRVPGVIIGCVDNGMARREIAERLEGKGLTWVGGYSHSLPREWQTGPRLEASIWWVDAGNGESYGQILIGNTDRAIFEADTCLGLPLPTIQRPDLLRQAPQQGDCADIPDQGPAINQVMASLVVEVVRRLIEGTCTWCQLYLDLETGLMTPVMASQIAKKKERR